MSESEIIYDVIVIGGGPGGSAAAKRCSEEGLHTILIEKKRLPRDKVCSGMVMGPWANDIINEEFGEIPQDILVDPFFLSGNMIHLPGLDPRIVNCRMPLTWRRYLDFWLNKKARDAGVDILDKTKVVNVTQENGLCKVSVQKKNYYKKLQSRFVIGADGASSVVRKSLFPELKVRYSAPVRECYSGTVDFDRNYIHWFFPKSKPRPRFDLLHKGHNLVLEGSGIRVLRKEINEILAEHGFDINTTPLWRDGCLMPKLHDDLVSGSLSPALGNTLLIGDAACLVFPITFEGIGASLKSGLIAAHSIIKAINTNQKTAASIYLKELRPVVDAVKHLYYIQNDIKNQAAKGPEALADALESAYEETLKVQK